MRHARGRHARARLLVGSAAAALVVCGAIVLTTALPPADGSDDTAASAKEAAASLTITGPIPAAAEAIPAPSITAAPAFVDVCANPAFTAAVAAGDDTAAIASAGGAEPLRAAIAAGLAPCVSLDDPAHVWVVVNKQRPYAPIDYRPSNLAVPEGVRDLARSPLRAEAGEALAAMAAAAQAAGAGEVALSSAYRSYGVQRSTYRSQVNARGTEGADLVSARPGYSEHQSGLAADVVACDGGSCGGLDSFAGTPQGDWVAAHAWEYGWIIRYEDGCTDITGYAPEPWHLRYVGPDLAAAYHDGGWRTLEEFFGLPPAPDYAD